MWISILNYNSGQIEVHDISEYYGNSDAILSDDEIAENWLSKEGYNPNNISYMITNDAPEIYDGNTQTVIDMPL
ncbi:hypothetical protein [Phocaeicola coprophilus]|uniref:hypothetical protein n=1 Tax=Phocaeicola coprophilus TaxID=387090 RepID=UPI0030770087